MLLKEMEEFLALLVAGVGLGKGASLRDYLFCGIGTDKALETRRLQDGQLALPGLAAREL